MEPALDQLLVQPFTLPSLDSSWREGLPVLRGHQVMLRELQLSDTLPLLAMLTTTEVARFISPPPLTIESFERFIVYANAERHEGRYACFAVLPDGVDVPVGIFQLRPLDPKFFAGDWGFALGSPYWGRGIFSAAAALMLEFAFETVGVHRLEARSVVGNGRGNGALRKVGAVCEGVLRGSLLKNGEYLDQHLWTILHTEWHRHRYGGVTVN